MELRDGHQSICVVTVVRWALSSLSSHRVTMLSFVAGASGSRLWCLAVGSDPNRSFPRS